MKTTPFEMVFIIRDETYGMFVSHSSFLFVSAPSSLHSSDSVNLSSPPQTLYLSHKYSREPARLQHISVNFTRRLERALRAQKTSPRYYAAATRIKDVVQFSRLTP